MPLLFAIPLILVGLLVIYIFGVFSNIYALLDKELKTRRFMAIPLHILFAVFILTCYRNSLFIGVGIVISLLFVRHFTIKALSKERKKRMVPPKLRKIGSVLKEIFRF